MHAIDFTTGLALLLRDGAQRDRFRADAPAVAGALNVRDEDRPAFITLSATELEVQADVLLRKRLDRVKHTAPKLCARLAGDLWSEFRDYARGHWSEDAVQDAIGFYETLLRRNPQSVTGTEWNRLRFHSRGAWLRIHFVRDLPFGLGRCGLQILCRGRNNRVRDIRIYLAF